MHRNRGVESAGAPHGGPQKIAGAWVQFNRLPMGASERQSHMQVLDVVDDIIQRDADGGWEFIEAVRQMDVDAPLLCNLAAGPLEDYLVAMVRQRSRGWRAWQSRTLLFVSCLDGRGRTPCRTRCGGEYSEPPGQADFQRAGGVPECGRR